MRNKSDKNSGAFCISEISKKCCEAGQDIHFNMKDKLLHLAPPTTNFGYIFSSLLDLGDNICFSFWCVIPAHLPSDQKNCYFDWGPEQQKALWQVQSAMLAPLPLGSYGPVDPMVLDVSVAKKDFVWSLCMPLSMNISLKLSDFGRKPCHLLWIIILLLRNSLWFAIGPW